MRAVIDDDGKIEFYETNGAIFKMQIGETRHEVKGDKVKLDAEIKSVVLYEHSDRYPCYSVIYKMGVSNGEKPMRGKYENMPKNELVERAKKRMVKVDGSMRKADIIALLRR